MYVCTYIINCILSVCLSVRLSVCLPVSLHIHLYHPTCIVQSGCPFLVTIANLHYHITGLSLSFETPVALIHTPMTNLLRCEYIKPTRSKFTRNTEVPSSKLIRNRCYSVQPLPGSNSPDTIPEAQIFQRTT